VPVKNPACCGFERGHRDRACVPRPPFGRILLTGRVSWSPSRWLYSGLLRLWTLPDVARCDGERERITLVSWECSSTTRLVTLTYRIRYVGTPDLESLAERGATIDGVIETQVRLRGSAAQSRADRSASTQSIASHGMSTSVLPKWPYADSGS